jgi:general secretion pathway protein A
LSIPDTPTYETSYGLSEKPFSLSSDPKFLFHSISHDRVAQALLSSIREHEGVVIVTGELGTGKTTLCRAVVEELDRRTLTSLVLDPFVSSEELLRTVLVDFGVISREDIAGGHLARATRQDLALTLRHFLLSLVPLHAFAVVLIDEAQNLPFEVLEQIRDLSTTEDDHRLLEVVLVGQPDLLRRIARSELKALAERASIRCRLEALGDEEIALYVRHRLAVAGSETAAAFDASALKRVSELSRRVPRVVNLLCDRALTHGYHASAGVITREYIDRAAEDLDIEPPESRRAHATRIVAGVILFLVLLLIGAGAAAFVFHDRLSELIERWEARPAPPGRPSLHQPAPFKTAPPPREF